MILEQWKTRDGAVGLVLGGVLHRMEIQTADPEGNGRYPLFVTADNGGEVESVTPLEQEDIDALHAFLGRFTSKEKEQ
jgi:hypothetical protein